jgi:enolase
MWTIEAIDWRRIYNSHVEATTEYSIHLAGGTCGRGASPQGETISIYEDDGTPVDANGIVNAIRKDGYLDRELNQESFDGYLAEKAAVFGKNTCYALSLTFFDAVKNSSSSESSDLMAGADARPKLCCNILNGGWHAYTNPVLSDYPEYLLVARSNDLDHVIAAHNEIQTAVHHALLSLPKAVVGGNPVSRFPSADNRECIDFLLGICDRLGLSDTFDLMIDASASDLWTDDGYRLAVTDDSLRSSDEFCDYWLDLLRQYPLRFLEDPLREQDSTMWSRLTTSQDTCLVIGDNFYASDAARIEAGAAARCTHGVIIKPNQAGTVTAVRRAIETAKRTGQTPITSHRSISTESPFEAILTCVDGVEYIKIGPLLTDYSSVIRLNEIIRLTSEVERHG